jgi:outer membrane immunogenic protein
MKKYLLATASILAIVNCASAADLAVKAPAYSAPVARWSGCYLGVQGGVVSHRGDFTDLSEVESDRKATDIGGTAGVNLACLRQDGSFVYGLEGDWMWVGAKASETFAFPSTNADRRVLSMDPDWIASVRARMGLAIDATLVYITGGVAFGHVKNSLTIDFSPVTFPGVDRTYSEDKTRVGWTVGFGVAHQFTQNWSFRAEGRYVDLGKSKVGCTTTTGSPFICTNLGTAYQGQFSNQLFLGLVGVDFKF